jgi:hydroxymethylglutaryl-CoA lyase
VKKEVKLIECPRDAWQGLSGQIPTATKVEYLRALIAAGFKHIDAVSFVSLKAVPQMADSEEVLKQLDPPDDVEIIGIVVNDKGAERAIATEAVSTLGFPFSVSETFLQRNQNQSIEQSFDMLESIAHKADNAGLDVVAYISMAFGNPYGDPWSIEEVLLAMENITNSGIRSISLADTVGRADANAVRELITAAAERFGEYDFGVHLHSRPDDAEAKILAAYDAGCRRFDSAIGGLGGCPFAQDALVGNIPTEAVLAVLRSSGATLPVTKPIGSLIAKSAEIASKYTSPDQKEIH